MAKTVKVKASIRNGKVVKEHTRVMKKRSAVNINARKSLFDRGTQWHPVSTIADKRKLLEHAEKWTPNKDIKKKAKPVGKRPALGVEFSSYRVKKK